MTRLAGVKSVSERACPQTWTGEIRTQAGCLPDLEAWSRGFREEVGQAFTIRGVEATVAGRLVEDNGRPALRLSATGEVLRLAPLRRKVQWDPDRQREQPITDAERWAYASLRARWGNAKSQAVSVRIVGPLVQGADGRLSHLEVREFAWDR